METTKSLHIQHVGCGLIPHSGGIYTSVNNFMQALRASGHAPRCLSFTDRGSIPASSNQSWEHVPIPDSIIGRAYGHVSRSELRGFEQTIRNADIVFIHVLYREHSVWAARIAQKCGIPVVVVPHGCLDPWVFSYRGLRKRIWLRMHREVLFGANSTSLFATDAEAEKARKAISSSSERIISWPAVRLTLTSDGSMRRKGVVAPRKLLFVGRIHPAKRVVETIRALARLNRTDWQLTLAGAATSEIPVETLRREAGSLWGGQIQYVGEMNREQLGALYAESDALLLFSHRENFGYVVAEAMCEGLPVVISDDVDLASLVTRSGSGIVKAIRTENDIAGALTDLLALSSEELTAMGISGARTGGEEFKFEKFAASLNALVMDITSKGPPRVEAHRPTAFQGLRQLHVQYGSDLFLCAWSSRGLSLVVLDSHEYIPGYLHKRQLSGLLKFRIQAFPGPNDRAR